MKPDPNLLTILLVEDNVDDSDAAFRSFRAAHLENPVHWCRSGKDALDYLRREGSYTERPRDQVVGLILLDLNMPGIDGRQVLAAAKQDPALRQIPVVVLTTSRDERDITRCYDLGASTYIQKPVEFDGLVEAISRIKDYWFGIALLPGVAP